MPKHGWKWRTEQVRKLTPHEHGEMLDLARGGHVSARMARWIYENCMPEPDEEGHRMLVWDRIASDEDAPWGRAFLWKELEKHKHELDGHWCANALTIHCGNDPESAERFMDLYEDESAHPETRGTAVHGVYSSLLLWNERLHPGFAPLMERIRATCAKALSDRENPLARAMACWLARELGGFEMELAILAEDRTPIAPGDVWTVADHVR